MVLHLEGSDKIIYIFFIYIKKNAMLKKVMENNPRFTFLSGSMQKFTNVSPILHPHHWVVVYITAAGPVMSTLLRCFQLSSNREVRKRSWPRFSLSSCNLRIPLYCHHTVLVNPNGVTQSQTGSVSALKLPYLPSCHTLPFTPNVTKRSGTLHSLFHSLTPPCMTRVSEGTHWVAFDQPTHRAHTVSGSHRAAVM